MKGFYAAFITETMKVLRSKVLWITFLLFIFIGVMMGLLMLVAKHPEVAENSAIISTKASFISSADWLTYLSLMIQMAIVLGAMGSGIVTIWIFGREYTDRVIKDILVLPVSRFNIVLSKTIITFIWSFLLLIVLFATAILTGWLVKLDGWTNQVFLHSIVTYIEASVLTIVLFTPVALITCASRNELLPVGFIILVILLTQLIFVGMPAITPYFPWAIPALIAKVAGPLNPDANIFSWLILISISLLGFAGTAAWWRYADQH